MGFQFHFPPAIRTVTKVADEGMYSNKKINFLNVSLDLISDIFPELLLTLIQPNTTKNDRHSNA